MGEVLKKKKRGVNIEYIYQIFELNLRDNSFFLNSKYNNNWTDPDSARTNSNFIKNTWFDKRGKKIKPINIR